VRGLGRRTGDGRGPVNHVGDCLVFPIINAQISPPGQVTSDYKWFKGNSGTLQKKIPKRSSQTFSVEVIKRLSLRTTKNRGNNFANSRPKSTSRVSRVFRKLKIL
jgi:hypothetical protein